LIKNYFSIKHTSRPQQEARYTLRACFKGLFTILPLYKKKCKYKQCN